MKEIKRVGKLLDDIYKGSPWIDVNLTGVLKIFLRTRQLEKFRLIGTLSGK